MVSPLPACRTIPDQLRPARRPRRCTWRAAWPALRRLLQVTHLRVTEAARGAGYGTRLVNDAESYARSRGAIGATVETHSFQARPFYERLGYEVFARLDGYPPGHVKFYLRKAVA